MRKELTGWAAVNRELRLELQHASLRSSVQEADSDQAGGSRSSVFFVSLPKSGTVYTWNSLQEMTGLKIPEFQLLGGWSEYNEGRDFSCPEIYACGDYNSQLLIPSGMKRYMRGFIFGSHMQASYHNIKVLEETGIGKITVLLRDPRDAFISWVHHLRNLGPSARNYHSKIYHIPRVYYDWSPQQQLDYQIRTFLPITVNWVEGWLDYYASSDRAIEVLFVYYDELKRDPARYFRRIAEFHEIGGIDYAKVLAPEPGKMHFRKGEHAQWLEEFSTPNRVLADDLMQNRILHCFHAAASRHPGLAAAETHLSSGNGGDAAAAALQAVTHFPTYAPAYGMLFRAAMSCGADTSALRRRVESELGQLTVEGSFIYRYELVDACAEFVENLAYA